MTPFLLQAIRNVLSIVPGSSFVLSIDVATTDEARSLATALNCSGRGTFDVLWEGTVIVNETITLTDGSVVTVTGVGSGAIADGGGITQLFTVSNATLYLADTGLENGYGPGDYDVAAGNGGAVWVGGVDSSVSCSGTTSFKNDDAENGGAVSSVDGPIGSWRGYLVQEQCRRKWGCREHCEWRHSIMARRYVLHRKHCRQSVWRCYSCF